MRQCACGIPNRANFHTQVILGKNVEGGTETTYTDIYTCTEHTTTDVRKMLAWDGHEEWYIIDYFMTKLG